MSEINQKIPLSLQNQANLTLGIFYCTGNLVDLSSLIEEGEACLKFIDRRSGYMSIFNYCPFTGIKIDWKKIRTFLKNYDFSGDNK